MCPILYTSTATARGWIHPHDPSWIRPCNSFRHDAARGDASESDSARRTLSGSTSGVFSLLSSLPPTSSDSSFFSSAFSASLPSSPRQCTSKAAVKRKGFPILSVGPGADPGVQAVSPQVTVSHPPGGRLTLLSARPAVTSPAAEHHRPLAGTKLYCLVTEAHRCEQLAQDCHAALPRVGFELGTY